MRALELVAGGRVQLAQIVGAVVGQRMSLQQFLSHLSAQGIAVVDHEPAELEQELAASDAAR